MTEQKRTVATKTAVKREPLAKKAPAVKRAPAAPLFQKENYMWMAIGAAVVALGMFLMSGGKNTDANKFDYNLVYSTTRITIAPILILLGLMVEIYAIFKKPKAVHHPPT